MGSRSQSRMDRKNLRRQKLHKPVVHTTEAPAKWEFRPEPLVAKTARQAEYIAAIATHEQVFSTGSAGTGKTFIAASMAADALREGLIRKIVLARPMVAAGGEEPGAFPGGVEQKIAPWVIPFTEIIERRIGKQAFQAALKDGRIEIVPLGMMRGRTFDQAYIILDEAQNASLNLLKMFLTRVGEGSKVIVNGDIEQTDLGSASGLRIVLGMIAGQQLDVPVIEFTDADVVRSGICRMWATAFRTHEKAAA
jgi:phosphate starvation-inducible PhoH-like protein